MITITVLSCCIFAIVGFMACLVLCRVIINRMVKTPQTDEERELGKAIVKWARSK